MKKKLIIAIISAVVVVGLTVGVLVFTKHEHNYIQTVTAPTCTAQGYTTYTCECGESYTDSYVDATGHDWQSATCGTPKICLTCNETDGTALGHTPASAVIENNVEADCINDGSYDSVVYCSVCDEELSRETIIVDALGHTEVIDQAVEASCTQTGLTEGKHCSVCSEVLVAQTVTPITDHPAESEWRYNETYHWHNSTCGCNQLIDYAEHTLEDSGWCSVCNQAIRPSNGIVYEASADGTYAEVVACASNLTKVKIASEYKGLPVTNIYNDAFKHSSITELVLPDTLLTIGSYAFYNCDGLTSIVIPDSVTSISDYAFSGCDGLTSIEIPDSVTSIGKSAFWDCRSLTSVVIGDSVTSIGENAFYGCGSLTSVVIGEGVTSIGSGTFIWCSSLTEVVIGDSVTSIGSDAFHGCNSLTEVNYLGTIDNWAQIEFSDSYANPLYYAKQLKINGEVVTEVNLTSATKVSNYAFYNCYGLTSIEISDSVTSIGSDAFRACFKLVEVINKSSHITITKGSSSNGYVGYYALSVSNCDNTYVSKLTKDNGYIIYTDGAEKVLVSYTGTETALTLPSCVTKIYQYAFYGCSSLISVVIPDSVTSIADRAFYNCRSLTSVVIGDSVISIGSYAFWVCSGLTSVVIGDSVTSIGSYAFADCYKLVEVINKSSHITVTKGSDSNGYVGYFALSVSNCDNTYVSKLTNDNGYIIYTDGAEKILVGYSGTETALTLPSYVTKIYQYAFYGCSSLTSVVISDSVTSIGDEAFRDCSSLTSVVISDSVTSIGDKAFRDCSSLTSVVIPDSVTSIGEGAFRGCDNLTSVVIGDSVTSIGALAFFYCSSLTSVVILDSVTSIGDSAFQYCDSLTSIEIPDSVTSIGERAFSGCSNLTEVYYKGDAECWNNITIGSSNSDLTNATRYYYSESQPAEEGNFWHYDENGVIVEW